MRSDLFHLNFKFMATFVLILVLMEYAHRLENGVPIIECIVVLILVLMEYALRPAIQNRWL